MNDVLQLWKPELSINPLPYRAGKTVDEGRYLSAVCRLLARSICQIDVTKTCYHPNRMRQFRVYPQPGSDITPDVQFLALGQVDDRDRDDHDAKSADHQYQKTQRGSDLNFTYCISLALVWLVGRHTFNMERWSYPCRMLFG